MELEAERIDIGWITAGRPHPRFVHSLSQVISDMSYFGCMGTPHMVQSSIPLRSRNMVVEEFLKGDSPWLWMVDDDMVFDKGHPMKLWSTANEHDVKMVAGLAFIFKDQQQPVPSYFLEGTGKFYPKGTLRLIENKIPEEPMEIAAAGLASALIHRDVFEAIEPARVEPYRWFDFVQMEGNESLVGEDVGFFVRARRAGFRLLLEPSAETWHMKDIGIGRKDFDRYWELRRRTA